jgi:putative transcriptional regulator
MIRYRLKELLAEKGVTYRQLSAGGKVSLSTLNKLIQDDPGPIQTDVLERICAYLNCHLNDLVIYSLEALPES